MVFRKGKVKLILCFNKHHATKTKEGNGYFAEEKNLTLAGNQTPATKPCQYSTLRYHVSHLYGWESKTYRSVMCYNKLGITFDKCKT
jgi:hypothetical protein